MIPGAIYIYVHDHLYSPVAAIAFGLAVYITYKATVPKITLVSCENCGSRRRPDMEICHQCGCSWDLAELTAPGWRVIDDGTGFTNEA